MKRFAMTVLFSLASVLSLAADDIGIYSYSDGLSMDFNPISKFYGYIDKKGDTVILPRYAKAMRFSEGLAFVFQKRSRGIELLRKINEGSDGKKDGGEQGLPYEGWMAINTKGVPVLLLNDSGLTPLGGFHGGLALAKAKEGMIFLNKKGEDAFKAVFPSAGEFSEGLASFEGRNAKGRAAFGYIDASGKTVIAPMFWEAREFHDGLAVVRESPNGDFSIIDKAGRTVFTLNEDPSDFSDGLCQVSRYDAKTDRTYTAFMDKTGKIALRFPQYRWVGSFSQGRAIFGGDNGKVGFVDKSGKEIVKAIYENAGIFSDGLAAVAVRREGVGEAAADGAGKTPDAITQILGIYAVGFIDVNGKEVFRPKLILPPSSED